MAKPREYTPEQLEHIELVKKYCKVGDTVTHTRCGGAIEEHIVTGWDGKWIAGRPTRDTLRIERQWYGEADRGHANDIAPINVLYINREPVRNYPFLESLKDGNFPPEASAQ